MSTTKDLDQLLQGFIDNGLPGCGMEVAKKGEVIYRGYFDYVVDQISAKNYSITSKNGEKVIFDEENKDYREFRVSYG